MARLGGLVVALIGVIMAMAGGGLATALLGRPLPDLPLLRDMAPYLAEVATAAAMPAGSGMADLPGTTMGLIALAGLGSGALIALAGLAQVVSGRRSALGLIVIVAALCGFAVAAALA